MAVPRTLTREIGSAGVVYSDGVPELIEHTPELRWPNSVAVYDRMRREDGQVGGVRRAYHLPLRRAQWRVDGGEGSDQVPPEIVGHVERSLGLGTHRRRRTAGRRGGGVRWVEFLTEALLYLDYGHMVHETVYDPDSGTLRKLAPRFPRTLSRLEVARDGMLDAVWQYVPTEGGWLREERLPIERLLVLVNEREGADWTGQSIHRQSYRHWLIRDRLMRLGPMIVERTGMGLPIVTVDDEAHVARGLKLATSMRAGETAGAAVPPGWQVQLLGVQGSTRDEIPLLKYHDEAMGRASLTMFLDLGHDAGARSLGETFLDLFAHALTAVADEVGEYVTEHVVRDLVRYTFGDDAPYPSVVADDLTAKPDLTADGLATLVRWGVVSNDAGLDRWARARYGLPDLDPEAGPPPSPSGLDDDPDPSTSDELAAAAAAELAATIEAETAELLAGLDRRLTG